LVGPKHTALLAHAVIVPSGAGDGVGVAVGLAVKDAVTEAVPLAVGDQEAVDEGLLDFVGVPVEDGVTEGVPLLEGVRVRVSDRVPDTVEELERVPDAVCVAVRELVTADVEESEAPAEGVWVVVCVAEHDGAAASRGEGQELGQGHARGAPEPTGQ
jgi:hypothetical protein